MSVFETMRCAVEAVAPAQLGDVATAIWKAYGAGGLTDQEAEQLDGLLQARQSSGTAMRARLERAPAAPALPACSRGPGKGSAGTKPRTPESTARRRRWAAAGYLPPQLAAAFTPAEQAALAAVAAEAGKRGACTLAIGHLAAVAGVCATIVKRALRLARTMGLVTVEERRRSRCRSETNVVRIASREWSAWLRLRLPRSALVAPGGTLAAPTSDKASEGTTRARKQGPAGFTKRWNSQQRAQKIPEHAGARRSLA